MVRTLLIVCVLAVFTICGVSGASPPTPEKDFCDPRIEEWIKFLPEDSSMGCVYNPSAKTAGVECDTYSFFAAEEFLFVEQFNISGDGGSQSPKNSTGLKYMKTGDTSLSSLPEDLYFFKMEQLGRNVVIFSTLDNIIPQGTISLRVFNLDTKVLTLVETFSPSSSLPKAIFPFKSHFVYSMMNSTMKTYALNPVTFQNEFINDGDIVGGFARYEVDNKILITTMTPDMTYTLDVSSFPWVASGLQSFTSALETAQYLNGVTYFSEKSSKCRVWKSDYTIGGTVIFNDWCATFSVPGSEVDKEFRMVALEDRIFVTISDTELWRWDAGETLVKVFDFGPFAQNDTAAWMMTIFGLDRAIGVITIKQPVCVKYREVLPFVVDRKDKVTFLTPGTYEATWIFPFNPYEVPEWATDFFFSVQYASCLPTGLEFTMWNSERARPDTVGVTKYYSDFYSEIGIIDYTIPGDKVNETMGGVYRIGMKEGVFWTKAPAIEPKVVQVPNAWGPHVSFASIKKMDTTGTNSVPVGMWGSNVTGTPSDIGVGFYRMFCVSPPEPVLESSSAVSSGSSPCVCPPSAGERLVVHVLLLVGLLLALLV